MTSKYFITSESSYKGVELFINLQLLKIEFNLNPKTLSNGLNKNRKGKSPNYSHLIYPDGVYINYATIPRDSFIKWQLPPTASDAIQFLKKTERSEEIFFKSSAKKILYENLRMVYSEKWPMFVRHYVDDFEKKSKRQRYAQNHALFNYILESEKRGESLKNLFELYKELFIEELSHGYRLIFQTTNYYSFLRKIREAKINIKNALIHKSKGVKRNDIAVLSDEDRNWILLRKCDQKNYTNRAIQNLLLSERGIIASRETIKKVTNSPLFKNITRNFSIGSSYVRKNQRPTIKRIFNYPGDQFQGDGSKLQFVCVDHLGKVISLKFYVVLDAYSSKVVGYSVDETENAEMIMNAFKHAFLSQQMLPSEIVVDNGQSYRSKEFEKFICNLKDFGVKWIFCAPDYPLQKAEVESFFNTFQKVINVEYPFYLGEGIKTKNTYGNPSLDLIKKYHKQKHLLWTKSQLIDKLIQMIKKYNDAYYKETFESVHEISGKREEKHDSDGTTYGLKTLLA